MVSISTLGNAAVLLSLVAATLGIGQALAFARGGGEKAFLWTKRAALTFTAGMIAANGLMEWALITHDFSVHYVAEVGSRETPLAFTIVSLWSSLDGSILFWGLILGLYIWGFVRTAGASERPQLGYTYAALFAVSLFFAWLIAGVASPFEAVSPVPPNGPGPNPLLQNHVLMIVHPPMLYGGYVGMAVPFAMAIGALASGVLDAEWMRRMRRALLVPWLFLTVGILLGGWWSYEVLGWGGYWAWDPVENASFLPWLTATAALHSSMVTERKGALRAWTLGLVLTSFLLTILGTFMTRSGVFNSVHSFTQSAIGPVFLVFLGVCLLVSVLLIAWRIDDLGPDRPLSGVLSRDGAFLLNNLFFVAFMFTVLLGTLYPLLNEALTGARVSVGEPYFNRMAVPIGVGLIALMGWGALLPWRPADPRKVSKRLAAGATAGLVIGGAFWASRGFGGGALYACTVAAAGFSAYLTATEMVRPYRERSDRTWKGLLPALWRSRRRSGAYVVHFGVLFIGVGIATSSTFRTESGFTLAPEDQATFGAYTLKMEEVGERKPPHRTERFASFTVVANGRDKGTLAPQLNTYHEKTPAMQVIGAPAVLSQWHEDLYLTLVQVNLTKGSESASIRVIIEPLVAWIWWGGGVMLLGGLMILSVGRARSPSSEEQAA